MSPFSFAAPKQPKNDTIVIISPITIAETPIDPDRFRISDDELDVITLPPLIRTIPAIYH